MENAHHGSRYSTILGAGAVACFVLYYAVFELLMLEANWSDYTPVTWAEPLAAAIFIAETVATTALILSLLAGGRYARITFGVFAIVAIASIVHFRLVRLPVIKEHFTVEYAQQLFETTESPEQPVEPTTIDFDFPIFDWKMHTLYLTTFVYLFLLKPLSKSRKFEARYME